MVSVLRLGERVLIFIFGFNGIIILECLVVVIWIGKFGRILFLVRCNVLIIVVCILFFSGSLKFGVFCFSEIW